MTNNQLMKKHLQAEVIHPLALKGFVGKYPHFRHEKEDFIELITFQANKYGGAFTIEVSIAFPHRENKNFVLHGSKTISDLTVWDTNERYRLKGMFDGWFYYSDVYMKYIVGFGRDYISTDKRGVDISALKGYKLVQHFDDNTAKQICDEANKQLSKAFIWLKKFEKKNS